MLCRRGTSPSKRGEVAGPFLGEERADEILGAYMKAIAAGDWRASESLLTPQEKLEVAVPTSLEQVEELSLSQIRALRGRLELVRDDAQRP